MLPNDFVDVISGTQLLLVSLESTVSNKLSVTLSGDSIVINYVLTNSLCVHSFSCSTN